MVVTVMVVTVIVKRVVTIGFDRKGPRVRIDDMGDDICQMELFHPTGETIKSSSSMQLSWPPLLYFSIIKPTTCDAGQPDRMFV